MYTSWECSNTDHCYTSSYECTLPWLYDWMSYMIYMLKLHSRLIIFLLFLAIPYTIWIHVIDIEGEVMLWEFLLIDMITSNVFSEVIQDYLSRIYFSHTFQWSMVKYCMIESRFLVSKWYGVQHSEPSFCVEVKPKQQSVMTRDAC